MSLAAEIDELARLDLAQLRLRWRNHLGGSFSAHLPKWLLVRVLAYRMQAAALGGLDAEIWRKIRGSSAEADGDTAARFASRSPATKEGVLLRPGALLVREWQGQLHRVMISTRVSPGMARLFEPVQGRERDHRRQLEWPSVLRVAKGMADGVRGDLRCAMTQDR